MWDGGARRELPQLPLVRYLQRYSIYFDILTYLIGITHDERDLQGPCLKE